MRTLKYRENLILHTLICQVCSHRSLKQILSSKFHSGIENITKPQNTPGKNTSGDRLSRNKKASFGKKLILI